MRLVPALHLAIASTCLLVGSAFASSTPLHTNAGTIAEHVTGGVLDLVWDPGFGLSNDAQPLTLPASDPAYANPSGDHTVLVATNSAPDSGGIILSATDPQGQSDYQWEAWMFSGDGSTRRGIVVRADPTNGFASCYQFVVQSGLFQLNFRKLINGAPTTLGTWFASSLPAGSIPTNTWHKIKVIALGTQFRCFFDDFELTAGSPITDGDLAGGWAGVYNFRFDLGGVPVYFDDLVLSPSQVTAAHATTWGAVQALYRR
jgi:hypothetical protein